MKAYIPTMLLVRDIRFLLWLMTVTRSKLGFD